MEQIIFLAQSLITGEFRVTLRNGHECKEVTPSSWGRIREYCLTYSKKTIETKDLYWKETKYIF